MSFGFLGLLAFLLTCAGSFVHTQFSGRSGSVRGSIVSWLIVVFLMDERVKVGYVGNAIWNSDQSYLIPMFDAWDRYLNWRI